MRQGAEGLTSMIARRAIRLLLTAVLGMGCLGFAAMLVAQLRDVGLRGLMYDIDTLIMPPICFVIGCFVGLFSCPVVAFGLLRTDLRISIPFVYVPSGLLVIWYTAISHNPIRPLDSALPAFASVSILSVLARYVCPAAHVFDPRFCQSCGYPIGTSSVCTECGAAVSAHRKSDPGVRMRQ